MPELKKNWWLKGYRHSENPPQTSPTSPLPHKNVQHACCTLYSMPSLHTVWCGHQCSVLCFAWCCPTMHHLHTSNANASRALVPQYGNVSAVVNLRVVGKRCQTSCTARLYYHSMGLYSHCSTVTLCILLRWWISTHYIRSTFRFQRPACLH